MPFVHYIHNDDDNDDSGDDDKYYDDAITTGTSTNTGLELLLTNHHDDGICQTCSQASPFPTDPIYITIALQGEVRLVYKRNVNQFAFCYMTKCIFLPFQCHCH